MLNNKIPPILIKNGNSKVILFTNARDELKIGEWVAHHLNLGFDIIYIFDHKSIIPIETIFNPNNPQIKIININKELPIKLYLMGVALNIAKKLKADWMLYLDADEFLCLNGLSSVKQFLNNFRDSSMIGINWLMFGTNNIINDPIDGLIVENYTKSDIKLHKLVKSFVRPDEVKGVAYCPHFYDMFIKNRIVALPKHINTPKYEWNDINLEYNKVGAFIAHYSHQSEETYKRRKTEIPTDDTGTFREINKNIHNIHNDIENNIMKNLYAEDIKKTLKLIIK